MATKKVKYLILGAGPTGLGAAWQLRESGETDFLVLEKDTIPGGLCRSYKVDSPAGQFVFDTAGHILFSKRQRFYDFVKSLGVKLVKHERNVFIRLFDSWIPYPLQNNVGHFPHEKAVDALTELATINSIGDGGIRRNTFGDYLLSSMGYTIASHFLLPYNRKVWSTDPYLMGTDWMGDRVSTVNFRQVLSTALSGKSDSAWGPNNYFEYPAENGFHEIFLKLVDTMPDKIRYEAEVTCVDPSQNAVKTSDGEIYVYDKLITTIPLDILTEKVAKHLSESDGTTLVSAAANLRHNKVAGVGVGYRPTLVERTRPRELEDRQPICWLYFPQEDVPFYRITQLSNYSTNSAPKGCRSWLCELSFTPETSRAEMEAKTKEVVPALKRLGLLRDEDEILCEHQSYHDYGYPIPTLGRDASLNAIQSILEVNNIFSRGRFGFWRYEVSNTDHSVLQGFELVDRLLKNATEELCGASA